MKKLLALVLALTMAMSMAACGSSEPASSEEEKKQLPVAETNPEETPAPLYKDIMKPYSEIQHGKRIIFVQNTLVFSREGVFTEAETPVAETVSYNGADYNGYPMTAATKFLTEGVAGNVTVYTTDGTSSTVAAADFEDMTVLIDDFQSGNSPILLAANGTAIENFEYAAMASGEIIASIITEQEYNVNEHLQKYGWDNTKTYNLVATDVFYIPITPEDYDEGGLRGALSGAINANFPDMIIATGKLNDVVFIEEIVG
ncbi:MAG: hypothetical protein IJ339_02750 [Oscillospiraceae bacterium]|nr:hypothetical protein [Oscillospiraceae bacterium]MBQ7816264.1 hypothetical protein [Oscillospiraceae bacterium]